MQSRAYSLATVTFIFLLAALTDALAQKTTFVVGRVFDAQTQEPLAGANVFIDNTTKGTSTDTQGRFSLAIDAGKFTIVISYVGYEPFNKTIIAQPHTDYAVDARLKPVTNSLDEISITAKRDKAWEALLGRFQKEFFGRGKNGRECTIANPWVLDLAENRGVLTATGTQPLIISNPALGYKLFFLLQSFTEGHDEYKLKGHVQFVPMVPQTSAETIKWDEKRVEAYRGSLRHFLRSVIQGDYEEQGFRVYIEKKEYVREFRSPSFSQDLGTAVDAVLPGALPVRINADSTVSILVDRRIEIHYLEKYSTEKPYKDIDHQVSWINVDGGVITSDRLGILSESTQFSVSGSMSDYRVGELLPFDLDFSSSGLRGLPMKERR